MLSYSKAFMGGNNTVQFITLSEKTQQAACGNHCYLSVVFLETVLLLSSSLLNLP